MMENLLEEYDNQDKQLERIHGKLSYLKYGYNSLKHKISTVECTMSERLGVTSNAAMCLETVKENTETKLCDIETCLDESQPQLDILTDLLHPCGEGSWRPVVKHLYSLPVCDTCLGNDECPGDWEEVLMNGRRFCGGESAGDQTAATCDSAMFPVDREYSRVCGRVIGYADGQSTGFGMSGLIDDAYVDGVSVTYEMSGARQHIWTFAAGLSSDLTGLSGSTLNQVCPCVDSAPAPGLPGFVGNNYFCESGLDEAVAAQASPIIDEPIWDGMGCPTNSDCCDEPPVFVTTVSPTSSALEVRICNSPDQQATPTLKNLLIEQIELYVE